VRRQLEGLRLRDAKASEARQEAPQARGYVAAQAGGLAKQVLAVLEGLPRELAASEDAPLRRLYREARRLDEELASPSPPPDSVLRGFAATLRRTVQDALGHLEQETRAREQRLGRVEALLGEVIAYRHLAREEATATRLVDLRDHLVRLLATGRASAAALELLDGEVRRLKAAVDDALERAALAAVLEERLEAHLTDLGYRRRPGVGPSPEWEIPGGERVRIAQQRAGRLAFQLVHERSGGPEGPLSQGETAFLRRQEARWCGDLHELASRLQADGFALEVQLERQTPAEAIPVVRVEDPDDWAMDDERHERLERRPST
jgi:hypothetical protein